MTLKDTMHNSGKTGWGSAVALALLLNVLMFGLMPGLLTGVSDYKELPAMQNAIDIFRIKRQEPPLPDKQKPEPKKEEPPDEKKVAREVLQQNPAVKPRLPFEINSRLPAGPGIVPTLVLEKYTTQDLGIFKEELLDHSLQELIKIDPRHPLRAERMGIEGWVKIKFIVTEEGRVDQVEVVDAEPKGVFEKAVINAAQLWRFSPPTVEGQPVKTFAERKIVFNFEDE